MTIASAHSKKVARLLFVTTIVVSLCFGTFVASAVTAAEQNHLIGKFRTPPEASVASDVAPEANAAPAGGAVKNVAPKVVKVSTADETVDCRPSQQAYASLEIRVIDANGVTDIQQISVQLSRQGQSYGNPIVVTQGTEQGPTTKIFTAKVPFEYYWPASSYASQTGHKTPAYYTATVTATDQKGATGTGAYNKLQYMEALGFSIDAPVTPSGSLPTLDFGLLSNGQSQERQSTMHNTANTPLTLTGTVTPWNPSVSGYPEVPADTLQAHGVGAPWVTVNNGAAIDTLSIGGTSPPKPSSIIFRMYVPSSVKLAWDVDYTTTITITGSHT